MKLKKLMCPVLVFASAAAALGADEPERGREVAAFLKRQQASSLDRHFDSRNKDALADVRAPGRNGALPYAIPIQPGGGIVYRHTGELDPLELKRAIGGHPGRTDR